MVQGPRGQAPAPAARSGLEAPAIRGSDGLWLVRQLVPAARPGRRAHLTAQGGVFCSALGNNILPLKPEEHSERRTHTIRFTQKSLSFFGKRCKSLKGCEPVCHKVPDRPRPGGPRRGLGAGLSPAEETGGCGRLLGTSPSTVNPHRRTSEHPGAFLPHHVLTRNRPAPEGTGGLGIPAAPSAGLRLASPGGRCRGSRGARLCGFTCRGRGGRGGGGGPGCCPAARCGQPARVGPS